MDDFDDEFEDDYPEYESVNLAWDDYTKFEEVIPDGNSTLIITLSNHEESKNQIKELKKIFQKEFDIEKVENKDGYEALKISTNNIENAILFDLYNCILVRLSNSKESKKIKNILEEMFVDSIVCEIIHHEEKFPIEKSELTALVRTGIVRNDEFWEPRSFWKFFHKDELIGKAVTQFHAPEMTDCAPTVKMFEVFEDFRRRGFGGQMIYGIEKYMYDYGFQKIRLDNTQATPFWIQNGYEIDIDEGEKYFDISDYED